MPLTKEEKEDVSIGCMMSLIFGVGCAALGLIVGVIAVGFWSGLLIGVGSGILGGMLGYLVGYIISSWNNNV